MQLRTESDNTHIETAKRASYGGQGELINSISWDLGIMGFVARA